MSKSRFEIELNASTAAALASPPGRPKQPTASATRPKATYDLHIETIQAIRDIAKELEVPVYAVAQRLLDYALEQRQHGRLELRRQPATTVWRLE